MKKSNALAEKFLRSIDSREGRELVSYLRLLTEHLENVSDPDPAEIRLVSSLYNFLEKFDLLRNNLQSYVLNDMHTIGSKLDTLYEESDTDWYGHYIKK